MLQDVTLEDIMGVGVYMILRILRSKAQQAGTGPERDPNWNKKRRYTVSG